MIRRGLVGVNAAPSWSRGAPRGVASLALGLALGIGLAACAPTGGASPSATSGQTVGQGALTPTAPGVASTSGASSATVTPLPGAANLAGATDICTSAVAVSAQLPADVPPYHGDLRLGQTNNGDGVFGYCVTDSVAVVAAFYNAQLPGKGWSGIQTFTNDATRNLIATHGSQSLTITVSPDVVQTGHSDLLIIVKGM